MVPRRAVLGIFVLIGMTLWATDHDVSIASVAVGAKPWQWTVFIKGTSEALGHVRCVQYALDPSFPNPRRTVCSRGTEDRPFPSSGSTWGPFTLSATVTFDDEKVQELQYTLDPRVTSLPDVLTGRWKFDPKKSSPGCCTQHYRIYSRVGDSIQVSVTAPANYSYIVVCDGQVHRTSHQNISCSFTSDGFQGQQEPPLRYFVDKVTDDTLTISTYEDAAHVKPVLQLVYEREPPGP